MYKDSSDYSPIKYYITEPIEIYIDTTQTTNMDFPLQNGKHVEVANWIPTTPTPIFNMGIVRTYSSTENV